MVGHIGFDSQAYAHDLHHIYFEANCGDGLMPLDMLFGAWVTARRSARN